MVAAIDRVVLADDAVVTIRDEEEDEEEVGYCVVLVAVGGDMDLGTSEGCGVICNIYLTSFIPRSLVY